MSFGSLDFIEDALEILDKSEFPYLLIVAQNETHTRMASNLGEDGENARAMKESVEDGDIPQQLLDHLEEFYHV